MFRAHRGRHTMSQKKLQFGSVCPRCHVGIGVSDGVVADRLRCNCCEHQFKAALRGPGDSSLFGPFNISLSDAAVAVSRVSVVCPSCSKILNGRREHVGQRVRCKKCGTNFPLRLPDEPSTFVSPSAGEQHSFLGETLQLRVELELLRADMTRAGAERDELRGHVKGLQAELKATGSERETLETERDELRSRLTTLSRDGSGVGQLGAMLSEIVQQLAAARTLAEELKSRVPGLEQKVDLGQADRERLESELETLRVQIETSHAENSGTDSRISELEMLLTAAEEDRSRLEYQLHQQRELLDNALAEANGLREEVEWLEQTALDGRMECERLDQQVQDLFAASNAVRDDRARLERELFEQKGFYATT
jgi:DNA repair exonuclease SbcCD ATPase subunit